MTITEQTITTDVLVVGSGIAGCFASVRAAELGAKVIVAEQGASGFHGRTSMGTNVTRVVLPEDDHDAALRGTVLQTDYMVDQEYAEEAIAETYDRFQDVLKMGGDFERGWDGKIKWMLQETDVEGFIQRQAIWKPFGSYKHVNKFKVYAVKQGVEFMDRTVISDLLVKDGKVVGAVGLNGRSGEFLVFKAKAVVLCTADFHAAGCNTASFTGDGMAMALRAGAGLRGMEFGRIGFGAMWPSYAQQQGGASDRMARTFRNQGEQNIKIINALGEEFVEKYEQLRRTSGRQYGGPSWKNYIGAIIKENREGRGPCFYDMGNVKFELGYNQRASAQTGGIRIDKNGCTTLPGLFAGGVASDMCGAMHFSIPFNLFGSSFTGRRAGESAASFAKENPLTEADAADVKKLKEDVYAPLKRDKGVTDAELRLKMIKIWPYLDYRTEETLTKALNEFKALDEDAACLKSPDDVHELVKCVKIRNVVPLAQAGAMAARERRESRIEHYRDDYPLMDNINWLKWVIVKGVGDEMHVELEHIPLEKWKYRPEPKMVDRCELRKEGE